MQRIEDIIKKNKEAFNNSEPNPAHFENFQKKLEGDHTKSSEGWFERYNIMLKIAAAILIFATVGTILYTDTFSYLKNTFTKIFKAESPKPVNSTLKDSLLVSGCSIIIFLIP